MDCYLDKEVNEINWQCVAIFGPLKNNMDSYSVILSSASAGVFIWLTMQKWGQQVDLGDYRPKYCIFSIDVLE